MGRAVWNLSFYVGMGLYGGEKIKRLTREREKKADF